MCCVIVPGAEAVIVSLSICALKLYEKRHGKNSRTLNSEPASDTNSDSPKLPWSEQLKSLRTLLLGGSALLAFEHVWHGEIVPFFPFLTAAQNPEDAAEMIHEISTSGVVMAVLVTVYWLALTLIKSRIPCRLSLNEYQPQNA